MTKTTIPLTNKVQKNSTTQNLASWPTAEIYGLEFKKKIFPSTLKTSHSNSFPILTLTEEKRAGWELLPQLKAYNAAAAARIWLNHATYSDQKKNEETALKDLCRVWTLWRPAAQCERAFNRHFSHSLGEKMVVKQQILRRWAFT